MRSRSSQEESMKTANHKKGNRELKAGSPKKKWTLSIISSVPINSSASEKLVDKNQYLSVGSSANMEPP